MLTRFYRPLLAMSLALPLCFITLSAAHSTAAPAHIAVAVQDPARPSEDVARDAQRKPAELLAFAEVKEGQHIADFMPGGGYFTRLFSKAVGAQGTVYGLVPTNTEALSERFIEILKKNTSAMEALAQGGYTNVKPSGQSSTQLKFDQPLDLVWTAQNYHDVYGFFGPEASDATNIAIFNALKPGGIYLVIDHVGLKGAGLEASRKIHRIDPELVKQQVLKAGFVFEGESKVLHNPQDDYTRSVFEADLRGKSDQFVFKFRKPK
jgi:predicted methyltransferase